MKVLTLTVYDPNERSHGGQIRIFEISQYLTSRGHSVCNAGILSHTTDLHPSNFLAFPEEPISHNGFSNWFLMDDAKLDIAIQNDSSLVSKLHKNIDFEPDTILVEQPWLIRLAVQYREEHAQSAKIIYGSQNIEFQLKETILLEYFPSTHAADAASIVKEIELFAIDQADACIAVTHKDASFIAKHCNNKPVVVVPNGSQSVKPSLSALSRMNGLDIPRTKHALFCASAHPPNIHGFFEYLSGHSACVTGDSHMVIVGTVGDAIKNDKRYENDVSFKHKMRFTGKVDYDILPALAHSAHVNVLPISQGGGSNLKTAEALLSEAYIVATSTALRGYEFAESYEHVFISDDPRIFKSMINETLRKPPCKLDTGITNDIKQRVLWGNILKPLEDLIFSVTINR